MKKRFLSGYLSRILCVSMAASLLSAAFASVPSAASASRASSSDADAPLPVTRSKNSVSSSSDASRENNARGGKGSENRAEEAARSHASADNADRPEILPDGTSSENSLVIGNSIDSLVTVSADLSAAENQDGLVSVPISWALDTEADADDEDDLSNGGLLPGDYLTVRFHQPVTGLSVLEAEDNFTLLQTSESGGAEVLDDAAGEASSRAVGAADSASLSCALLLTAEGIRNQSGTFTLTFRPSEEENASDAESTALRLYVDEGEGNLALCRDPEKLADAESLLSGAEISGTPGFLAVPLALADSAACSEETASASSVEIAGQSVDLSGIRRVNAPETAPLHALVRKFTRLLALSAADSSDASGHFHASITAGQEAWPSASTALYSVRYTLDQNAIHEGDYIFVTVPETLVSSVDLAVSPQHFSKVENQGGGRYKLTFGPDAATALSGSFAMFVNTRTVTEQGHGTITAGSASAAITVNPAGTSTGVGTFTDTIAKDAWSNDGIRYGGYDTSRGDDKQLQIDIMSQKLDSVKYRLYVNRREGTLTDVTVIDYLPEGMSFDSSKAVQVYTLTGSRLSQKGRDLDPSEYEMQRSEETLTFSFPKLDGSAVEIDYWLTFDDPDSALSGKYTNTAVVNYTENGSPYANEGGTVLQGLNYNAANGEKSVDKSEISSDPDDQTVTYTIKFWNNNRFSAGDINLTDTLDSHVRYLGAVPNAYFTISQDESDPQKIHITNTTAIPGDQTIYVHFMTDFTDVPGGYTVFNTVGGNTVKTLKTAEGIARLSAVKQVDGKDPGESESFSFELRDASGRLLQTKSNESSVISFDPLKYGKKDCGKTFRYSIREMTGTSDSYLYDSTAYIAEVTAASASDAGESDAGKSGSGIQTTVRYYKVNPDGSETLLESGTIPVFENRRRSPSTPDNSTPDNSKPVNPKPDNPTPDNPKPDNPTPVNPTPATPDNGGGSSDSNGGSRSGGGSGSGSSSSGSHAHKTSDLDSYPPEHEEDQEPAVLPPLSGALSDTSADKRPEALPRTGEAQSRPGSSQRLWNPDAPAGAGLVLLLILAAAVLPGLGRRREK